MFSAFYSTRYISTMTLEDTMSRPFTGTDDATIPDTAADSAAETRAPRGGKRSRTEPAHRADEGFFGPGSVAWKD